MKKISKTKEGSAKQTNQEHKLCYKERKIYLKRKDRCKNEKKIEEIYLAQRGKRRRGGDVRLFGLPLRWREIRGPNCPILLAPSRLRFSLLIYTHNIACYFIAEKKKRNRNLFF